jgi:hypothetical protein
MLFSSWLRNGKRSALAAPRRLQISTRQRAGFRPRFESLEDRKFLSASGLPYPTAATVSQLTADINYADTTGGAFTVNLQPSTTFALTTSGLPVVGGAKPVDLTILGNGDTIDGLERGYQSTGGVFNVAAGASLTLDHVTLQGGFAKYDGGAIYNNGGTVAINNSILRNNSAAGSDGAGGGGGAIDNERGTVTVSNSTLSNNSGLYGGDIYNLGTVAISNSVLSNNTARRGGGIYNFGTVTVSDNSTLSGNTCYLFFGDPDPESDGGGIYNWGGTVTINHSTVSGNSVDLTYGSGGGIDNLGTLTVENYSSITRNTASYGADMYGDGVLHLDSTSTIGVPLDPNIPQLQISCASVTEGNSGSVAAQFIVTLSAASTDTITVAYATANGSATADIDYQAASGNLTFDPGQTSKTITVLVNGDRLGEPNETFFVKLSGWTNATVASGQGVGTIVDDEPRISISDVSKTEGKKGQTTLFTFTITFSAAYDQPVTMSYQTVNGTATTGDKDYVAKSGTLTFAPGETTKTITIAVNGDSKKEPNETFYLDLFGNSSNSLFSKSRGIGTILNDD